MVISLEWVKSFATLTGSSLLPGYPAKDLDYFALYDAQKIKAITDSGVKAIHKNVVLESVEHWCNSVCFTIKGISEKPVHLFFVKPDYHKALTLYTDTMTSLVAMGGHWPWFLSLKDNRVALCESFRRVCAPTPSERIV